IIFHGQFWRARVEKNINRYIGSLIMIRMPMTRQRLFLFLGPALFIIVENLPLEGLSPEGQAVLATTCWVAIWWITEAVELELTAMMPILLLPVSGGLNIAATTASYGHPYIFL